MDEIQIKNVVEAALLAAGRPLPFDKIASLFASRASELDKATLQNALDALAADYKDKGLELKEVSSGYRIQIRRSMSDWLTPLWDERAPRYTRALLETLALIAYRQPITRAEIEEVRGVTVSTNITRTLLERNWIRVVGHRDVPGKPAMFGTTRDFLDYFGLKKLEDLPPLADVKDGLPESDSQADLIDTLEEGDEGEEGGRDQAEAVAELRDAAAAAAAASNANEAGNEDAREAAGADETGGDAEISDTPTEIAAADDQIADEQAEDEAAEIGNAEVGVIIAHAAVVSEEDFAESDTATDESDAADEPVDGQALARSESS